MPAVELRPETTVVQPVAADSASATAAAVCRVQSMTGHYAPASRPKNCKLQISAICHRLTHFAQDMLRNEDGRVVGHAQGDGIRRAAVDLDHAAVLSDVEL